MRGLRSRAVIQGRRKCAICGLIAQTGSDQSSCCLHAVSGQPGPCGWPCSAAVSGPSYCHSTGWVKFSVLLLSSWPSYLAKLTYHVAAEAVFPECGQLFHNRLLRALLANDEIVTILCDGNRSLRGDCNTRRNNYGSLLLARVSCPNVISEGRCVLRL